MTASPTDTATLPPRSLPALRAFAVAAVGAAALAVAVASALRAAGVLAPELVPAIVLGFGAAVLASAVATLLHVRATRRVPLEREPRQAGLRLQALLGAAFVVKLLAAAAGIGTLALLRVKFEFLAAFALAFAGAALVLQFATVLQLARALARTARTGPVHTP
jgi:hypothetical protein